MPNVNLTDAAREVLVAAQELARKSGSEETLAEHLLLALLASEDSVPTKILRLIGADITAIKGWLERQLPKSGSSGTKIPPLASRTKIIIDIARAEAQAWDDTMVALEHLFLAIIRENVSQAGGILLEFGADLGLVRRALAKIRENESK